MYCCATQKEASKVLPQMTVIRATNMELLKLKLGTHDLQMMHYTNLLRSVAKPTRMHMKRS